VFLATPAFGFNLIADDASAASQERLHMRNLTSIVFAVSFAALSMVPAFADDELLNSAISDFHAAWCDGTYRNYDPATDTFAGFDGQSYVCVSPAEGSSQTLTFGSATGPLFVPTPAPEGHAYGVFPSENDPSYSGGLDNNGSEVQPDPGP
jgi:hypothetical protein